MNQRWWQRIAAIALVSAVIVITSAPIVTDSAMAQVGEQPPITLAPDAAQPTANAPAANNPAAPRGHAAPAVRPKPVKAVPSATAPAVARLAAGTASTPKPPVPVRHATAGDGGTAVGDASINLTGNRLVTLAVGKAVNLVLPRDAREVMVADPTISDVVVKTPRRAYLIGKVAGETNAFFVDEAGERILTLNIRVGMDIGALRAGLAALLPGVPVKAQAINDTILLSGEVASAEIAESARQLARRFVKADPNVVNMLRITDPEQVVIRVKVTEMRRTVAKRLGLNLLSRVGNHGSKINLLSGSQTAGENMFDNTFTRFVINGRVSNFLNLSAALEALEADGYVKTLAEPNLTAMSGEAANFLAGGEFPIPTGRDLQGNVTIQFKPYGIGLKFTPVVLDGGRISMRISSEVSAITRQDSEGALVMSDTRIPALTVRRTETTVEIPSGASLVLSGLLSNQAINEIRGFPGLSSLPVLGQLFRSDDFQRQESELVVVATPYIVRSARPEQFISPTDGFRVASDAEEIFLAKLFARYPGIERQPTARSPVGFVLE